MLKIKNALISILSIGFVALLINYSGAAINGATYGMILCAEKIIPSLFPFTAITVFIYNGNYLEILLERLKRKQQIIIFLISLIGGYPIGAKLISEAYNTNKINKKDAENMLCCCVNVGPAFSISVVGALMFNSTRLGVLIFIASILSALEMFLIFCRKFDNNLPLAENKSVSISDNFVNSVASASVAIITVCSFIILFSTAVNIVKIHVGNVIIKNTIIAVLEITTAISEFSNVYLIAFLIGFGGLSIFMQILSLSRSYRPNVLKILVSRLINGIFMLCNVFILLKLFKVDTPTISNGYKASFSISQGNIIFSFLFVISSLCLIYILKTKKYCGILSKDIF